MIKAIINKNIFSKLSFVISLISIGFTYHLISSIPNTITVNEGMPSPQDLNINITLIFCFTGIIFTILSFVKKEKSSWYKWIGAIINIMLFLLFTLSITFAKILQ